MSFKLITASILLLIWSLLFAGCATGQSDSEGAPMPDKLLDGATNAPDFPAGLDWLNTKDPISIKDLNGKLVLLDFWTFCCINCIHVIPDLKKLEEKYDEELVVIGVHSAKFTNEQGTESIRQAVLRYGIEHPVVNDRDFQVWNTYGARAWPTLVLINPNGKIVGMHSGEGAFDVFDPIISRAVEYFDATGDLVRSPLELELEKKSMPNMVLAFPGKVKADEANGRLIITDSDNDRILLVSPDGDILDVIGSGMIGSEDGSFESASFSHPQGTSIEGYTLYIADTENHLIRAADLRNRTVTTILGTGSQARKYNDPGYGRSVALNSPWDVLYHDGKLFIAMAGSHQLWVADLESLYAEPYAGSAREDIIDGPRLQAALAQPSGLSTDGKSIFFTDSETSSIRAVDIAVNGEVRTLVGEGLFDYGDKDGKADKVRLQHPLGVVYYDGVVYIADTYNSKIKTIDPETGFTETYAGTGGHGYEDGDRDDAKFSEPGGLTILGRRIYIADTNNHLIRVIDMDSGEVSTLVLRGLEKLRPESGDTFAGRTVEIDGVTIAPGMGNVNFDFKLPRGYKFADGAPLYVEFRTGDKSVVSFDGNRPSNASVSFPYDIPFDALEGMTEVEIDAYVYFCEGDSKVCLFDNVRVTIPVTINSNGTNQIDVDITARTMPM